MNHVVATGAGPLMAAVVSGSDPTVQCLLVARADANSAMTIQSRHTPLTMAAYFHHFPMYDRLLASGADASYRALQHAIEPFSTDGGTADEILEARRSDYATCGVLECPAAHKLLRCGMCYLVVALRALT